MTASSPNTAPIVIERVPTFTGRVKAANAHSTSTTGTT